LKIMEKISIKPVLTLMSVVLALAIPCIPGVGAGFLGMMMLMYVFIMYACAWNLLAYSGQGSLGHSAFLGLGAYGSVLLAKGFNVDPLLKSINVEVLGSTLAGGLLAAVAGVLIGLTCVRLREWFLGMATFGFAIIIHTITTELSSLTGGHDGLPTKHLVSVSDFLVRYQMEYYIILISTLIAVYVMYLVLNSRIGLAFQAIRENELEAKVMGVNIVKYKLVGFALSAFFSGVAGALMIHHIGYLTPEIFSIDNSFKPIIYSIAGGLSTIEGPILGTVIVTALWDGLKSFGLVYEHLVIIGLLLIGIVIFLPRGFVSLLSELKNRISNTKI